jgi:hypothetical protein
VRGFGRAIAHGAVSRRPPISFDTVVPRTGSYTYDVGVWGLSVVQGPFSVAPVPTPSVTIRSLQTRLPPRGDVRVSGRSNTPSWVYRKTALGPTLEYRQLPHGRSTHSLTRPAGYTGDGSRADSGVPPAASRPLHSSFAVVVASRYLRERGERERRHGERGGGEVGVTRVGGNQ